MDLQINHLQHIGVPVRNLAVSQAFYERLGFQNAMTRSFPYEGDTGHVVMMQRGAIIMELYQFPEPELSKIRARKDGHVDHVAFDVSDIDATYNTLKNNGFHCVESEPQFLAFWERGCKYFNILGPDGERLEFNQIL